MGQTVLVVDDEYYITRSLTHLLRRAGFHCLAAKDGEEALRIVRAERPRVVLLDVDLPGMSGLDVLRSIQADPSLDEVSVYLLTALPPAPNTADRELARVREVLLKPFDPREILWKVAEAMSR